MAFELADRPPPVGSLKEELFLLVWLKRQEAELARVMLVASAANDLVEAAGGSNSRTVAACHGFIEAFLPFAQGQRTDADKKLIEVMHKEVTKGAILFKKVEGFRDTAQRMSMPQEFKNLMKKEDKP